MRIITQDEIQNKSMTSSGVISLLSTKLLEFLLDQGGSMNYSEMMEIYKKGIARYSGNSLLSFIERYPTWSEFPNLPFSRFVEAVESEDWVKLKIIL